jgi:hypothetical protein
MVRVAALKEWFDRRLGRPAQSHTVEGSVAHSFNVITHVKLFEGDSVIDITPSAPLLNGSDDGSDDKD